MGKKLFSGTNSSKILNHPFPPANSPKQGLHGSQISNQFPFTSYCNMAGWIIAGLSQISLASYSSTWQLVVQSYACLGNFSSLLLKLKRQQSAELFLATGQTLGLTLRNLALFFPISGTVWILRFSSQHVFSMH